MSSELLAGPTSPGTDVKVFVSSTSKDLESYRAAARLAVLDVGWTPRMMEHFGALSEPTLPSCLDAVAQCDVLLLIIAHRRGWVPGHDQGGDGRQSVTALELAQARKLKKPVFILVASDTWPGNRWEDDPEARTYVRELRAELNQPAMFFDAETEAGPESERLPIFRAKVRDALQAHRLSLMRLRAGGGPKDGEDLRLEAVWAGLKAGSRIPFVGPGIFEEGPLSVTALIQGLLDKNARGFDDTCLATAAEYCERLLGSRYEFLSRFQATLTQQTEQASAAEAHDLLVRFEKAPLIVSATCDRRLEQAFGAAGIGYVVISHVLRSFDDEHAGKILLERSDGSSQIQTAAELVLSGAERVIYKPVGSPILSPDIDAELELDTVVATEADHFLLFRFLQNQITGGADGGDQPDAEMPGGVHRVLARRWPFRLLTQVLRAVGRRDRGGASPFAVREPRTQLEQLSWQEIGVNLIAMKPNDFARQALARHLGPAG